jgi:hypothetical protein
MPLAPSCSSPRAPGGSAMRELAEEFRAAEGESGTLGASWTSCGTGFAPNVPDEASSL